MQKDEAIAKLAAVIRRKCTKSESKSTERTYCQWVRRYCDFVQALPPVQRITLESERKAELFLTFLAQKLDVAASTQNQALAALNFFYLHVIGERLKNVDALRATRPQQVREAVSQPETLRLLNAVPDVAGYPTRLIVRLIYGCGLRVSEPLNIRIKDLLNSERQVVIHGAKGGKDRVVNLPCSVQDQIIQQKVHAKKVFERDGQCKIPIWLPHQLARKYPEYQFAWAEAWLFPQRHPCADPRTGQIVRYHLHAANVQRAVKVARRASGVFATPHVLRHCYATHCLENGARLKALQEAMGHKYAETTMGYVHEEALSVRSPLEVLG